MQVRGGSRIAVTDSLPTLLGFGLSVRNRWSGTDKGRGTGSACMHVTEEKSTGLKHALLLSVHVEGWTCIMHVKWTNDYLETYRDFVFCNDRRGPGTLIGTGVNKPRLRFLPSLYVVCNQWQLATREPKEPCGTCSDVCSQWTGHCGNHQVLMLCC